MIISNSIEKNKKPLQANVKTRGEQLRQLVELSNYLIEFLSKNPVSALRDMRVNNFNSIKSTKQLVRVVMRIIEAGEQAAKMLKGVSLL